MGYLNIDNLYKNASIMMFRECFAMEKIHGTSAHVSWNNGELRFFSGGEKYENFVKLFDAEKLAAIFTDLGHAQLTVYGEAYGGKQQGMSKTYGTALKFVAFDVKHGDKWLDVESADGVCNTLGLEFVHYKRVPTDIESLDAERDKPSTQAIRNGITEPCISEGVVLRPIYEFTDHRGNRIIAKHKRPEFRERKSIPNVDPAKRELMDKADSIAEEFVTDMRLTHVLDKMGNPLEFEAIGAVNKAMYEDILREEGNEFIDSPAVRKAIGAATVKLYKKRITKV